MVLIPADIGLRMRLQNELLPQPITPAQEIPVDLPGLKTGQAFSARIQEVLPENTYRALVAGKTITLSLPESAKSGDTLELIVVDRTPRTIIARLASPNGGAVQTGSATNPYATFSRAAQMLSSLLVAEGEAPRAAPLNRGLPLLAQAPRSGADLVPVLSKAVAESGLFYESHQAQWVTGKLPLANLLQEPQGKLSAPQAQIAAAANKLLLASLKQELQGQNTSLTQSLTQIATQAGKLPQAGMQQEPQGPQPPATQAVANAGTLDGMNSGETAAAAHPTPQQAGTAALALNLPAGREESTEAQRLQANSAHLSQGVQSVPEELRPLVQQQLDAAGTQRLLWHGEVWPGQTMQWRVEWEGQGDGDAGQNEPEPWSTTLRLTTPRLGEVEAALKLGASGVRIALTTPYAPSVAVLRDGTAELEQALAAAGVPLRGLTVKHGQEPGNEE